MICCFFYSWINNLFSEEHNLPKTPRKRWQGPPEQYEIVLPFKVSLFI